MNTAIDHTLKPYFSGQRLYGEDLSPEEIQAWYRDEEDAYFKMWAPDRGAYVYEYSELNRQLAFAHLPSRRFRSVLAFGGGYGDELLPVLHNAEHAVIVDPGAYDFASRLAPQIEYRKPSHSGRLPASAGEFELVTCFSALHHIPNVSAVISDFYRVLTPGGFVLLREPTISMGDWRGARIGLTKRERGIPLRLLDQIVTAAGFEIMRRTRCVSPAASRLARLCGIPRPFNSPWFTRFDRVACVLAGWQNIYHPVKWWQKLQPSAACYVLRKPPNESSS
jgi:SAM-dependent methyltransferase